MDGKITVQFTVWCAKCNNYKDLGGITKIEAIEDAQYYGWEKLKRIGWVCPICEGREVRL